MASNRKGMRCMSFFLFLYSVVVILLLVYFFTQHFWHAAPVNPRHKISKEGEAEEEESVHPFRESLHTPAPQSPAVSGSPKAEKLKKPAFQRKNTSQFRQNVGNVVFRSGLGTQTLEETFQPVNNHTIFVYSAYLRNMMHPPQVMVVAIVNRSAMVPPVSLQINCVYDGGDDEDAESSIAQGKLRIFPDHHGRVFSAAYISCPAPKTLTTTRPSSPVTVSLSTPRDRSLANRVRIQTPGPRQYQFLVCFSPLHSAFGDAVQMVANLELARVLGAEHAVVYNTSVSPRVSQVLRRYVSTGFLQVKSWTQPPEPIHYKGQLGAINDCLLQNTNRTEFIVFMDFDEMIVPRVHASWSALVHALFSDASPSDFISDGKNVLKIKESFISRIRGDTRQHSATKVRVSSQLSPVIGAVKFPSAIFLKDTPTNLTSDDRSFAVKLNVKYLLRQRKTQQLWTRRTKSIVNPRAIYIMGIHLVHSFLHGEKSLVVNETVGLCQHYRWYSKVPSTKDTNILRFSSVLVKRMKQVFKELDSV